MNLFRRTVVRPLFGWVCLWFLTLAGVQAQTISSFSPTSGDPGTSVTITGSGFSSSTTTNVTFNGARAIFQFVSSSTLVTTVPADASTGFISVNNTSSSQQFSVAPVITGFSPASAAPGTVGVQINGNNFSGTTNVTLNGTNVVYYVTAQNQIQFVVPADAVSGYMTVSGPLGTSTSPTAFTVATGPVITSFLPVGGTIGTTVTINGINLTNIKFIKFNGPNGTAASLNPTNYTGAGGSQLNVTVPSGAVSGPISIATTNGALSYTNTTTSNFLTGSGPIVTDFSPASGIVGSTVIISGYNFGNGGNVQVTFSNASPVTVTPTAATQISVTVPSGAKTGPVIVKNLVGGLSGTNFDGFTVLTGPYITSFTPTSGAAATFVYINGTGLDPSSSGFKLFFNTTQAATPFVTGQNGTQVRATVPSGATTGPITVQNTTGTNTTSSNFVVNGSAPVIDSFTPNNGRSGDIVQIAGLNFANAGTVTVTFSNASAVTVTPAADNQIQVAVPAAAVTGPIKVTSSTHGSVLSADNFYVWQRLTNFGPTSGFVGTSLSVTGANLTGITNVLIGRVPATFTVNNSTNISVTVPASAVPGNLRLIGPAGIVGSTNFFIVLPKIDSFTPVQGPVGTKVQIVGSGFTSPASVEFNGVTATNLLNSSQSLTATVPAAAHTGLITVICTNGTAISLTDFVVIPGITNFTPTNGPPGTFVNIYGTTLDQVTNVQFNGVNASFTLDTLTHLAALVPATATTGPITVQTAEADISSTNNFVVHPTLLVTNTAGQLVLAWPSWATGFKVQTTTNLDSPITWTTLTNASSVSDGFWQLTNSPTNPIIFFRLKE